MSKTIDGTVKIANLSSLDSLKNVNSTYSKNSKESSNSTLIGQILDKMDRLEKAFDVTINMDSREVGKLVTPAVSNQLAFNSGRKGW